ncbi:MAG: hypothetical protein DLM70_16585 [Chloroflexi bacterium]|nr:MAG: hypothetical protein DLM70_16585 [Chloroflexota bacterium]
MPLAGITAHAVKLACRPPEHCRGAAETWLDAYTAVKLAEAVRVPATSTTETRAAVLTPACRTAFTTRTVVIDLMSYLLHTNRPCSTNIRHNPQDAVRPIDTWSLIAKTALYTRSFRLQTHRQYRASTTIVDPHSVNVNH